MAAVLVLSWPTGLKAQSDTTLDLTSLNVTGEGGTSIDLGTFDPATTSYSGNVASTVERITVAAGASAGSAADVQILPADSQMETSGHQIDLSHGKNIVLVSVHSFSIEGALKTYQLDITRAGSAQLGADRIVTTSAGDYWAREGSTVPFLVTRTGDTSGALTVQIEITESNGDMVPSSSEGQVELEFQASEASVRHDVATSGDSVFLGTSFVQGTVLSGTGYTARNDLGTSTWHVWDDDQGSLALQSIAVSDQNSTAIDIGAFNPDANSYSATVDSTVEYVTVSAVKPPYGWWGTFIIPDDAKSGVSGHQVALSHGSNLIVVGVHSNDPSDAGMINTYELEIERSGSAPGGSSTTVSVSSPGSAKEGAALPFVLTRTGDTSQSLTVQVEVTETGGAKVSGSSKGQKDVQFQASDASARLNVPTMGDEVWEEHSTVKVEIEDGTGYEVSQSGGSTSTLVEDDDTPDMTAVLSLDATDVEEGDEIAATITVTTDDAEEPHEYVGSLSIKTHSGSAGELDFEIVGINNSTLALSRSSFAPVETDGVITAYQTEYTAKIIITDDQRAEPDETFTVTMESKFLQTDALTLNADSLSHTVTIAGEDETPQAPAEAGYAEVVVEDSGTTGSEFTVSWNDPTGCSSNYSVKLKGGYIQNALVTYDGREFGTPYQDIGSTASANRELTGTLDYIDTKTYVELLGRYAYSDGLAVVVYYSDYESYRVGAELPLPVKTGDTVERPKPGTYSSEAPLTGLTISSGTLAPAFNKDGFLYAVLDVPNEDDQVTFTATAKDNYTISWTPQTDADSNTEGHQVDLLVGYNTVYVTVDHDEDINSFVYEVIVKRAEEAGASGSSSQNSPADGAPSISGTAQVGETLTADTSGITDADGLANVTYSYQWIANDGTSDTDIPGATDSTYVLVAADEGKTIKVLVSFTDDAANGESLTSGATDSVQGSPPDTPDKPTGNAVFVGGVDLEWNDVAEADSYDVQLFTNGQWTDLPEDGIEVAFYGAGAIVSGLDPSSTLWFQVRARNSHGLSDWSDWFQMPSTEQSASGRRARPANEASTGAPFIRGTAKVGETLTADTAGIEDGNGLEKVRLYFQWVANDGATDADIPGATDATYTLTSSDVGKTIKVTVSFTDRGGFEETLTSAATGTVAATPNNPAAGAPTITGTAQVGETLAADTSGIADADGLANVSYSYQWISNDGNLDSDITDATGSGYTLVAADEGKTIKVKVSFTDDADNDETLTSAATGTVLARPNSSATGTPTITGTAQVGETLTADTSGIADSDGLTGVSYSYQWISNDGNSDSDITDATGSTYTLVAADEGKTIKVKVTFTDDADNDETLTSTATASVIAAGEGVSGQGSGQNSAATGSPTITGTAQVGETLTADTSGIVDSDGLTNVSYSYQWIRNDGNSDSDITDATGSTYTLVAGDEGKTIKVKVTFTDDADNDETLTSAATGTVAAMPSPLTVSLENYAASHDGQSDFTFVIRFSEEFQLSFRTLRDHAFTVDGGTVSKAKREEKGSNIGWTIAIMPDSNDTVTISLPVTTDCGATGAICTEDGRILSNSLSFTVSGPGG